MNHLSFLLSVIVAVFITMWQLFKGTIKSIAIAIPLFMILALVVFITWNLTLPLLFSVGKIGYFQSIALLILVDLLFTNRLTEMIVGETMGMD